jgi:type 1 glutamine amidotransferase
MSIRCWTLAGDYYHPAATIVRGLQPVVEKLGWRLFVDTELGTIDWSRFEDVDLFVMARMGAMVCFNDGEPTMPNWMTDEIQQSVERFVAEGGGLLVIHAGTAIIPENGTYRRLIGGRFRTHPPQHAVRVEPTGNAHPVTEGVRPFTVNDEQYFMDRDDPQATVLATGTSESHGSDAAAWAHERGQGRVCVLTLGHNPEVFQNEGMRRLLSNAARWCAGA